MGESNPRLQVENLSSYAARRTGRITSRPNSRSRRLVRELNPRRQVDNLISYHWKNEPCRIDDCRLEALSFAVFSICNYKSAIVNISAPGGNRTHIARKGVRFTGGLAAHRASEGVSIPARAGVAREGFEPTPTKV